MSKMTTPVNHSRKLIRPRRININTSCENPIPQVVHSRPQTVSPHQISPHTRKIKDLFERLEILKQREQIIHPPIDSPNNLDGYDDDSLQLLGDVDFNMDNLFNDSNISENNTIRSRVQNNSLNRSNRTNCPNTSLNRSRRSNQSSRTHSPHPTYQLPPLDDSQLDEQSMDMDDLLLDVNASSSSSRRNRSHPTYQLPPLDDSQLDEQSMDMDDLLLDVNASSSSSRGNLSHPTYQLPPLDDSLLDEQSMDMDDLLLDANGSSSSSRRNRSHPTYQLQPLDDSQLDEQSMDMDDLLLNANASSSSSRRNRSHPTYQLPPLSESLQILDEDEMDMNLLANLDVSPQQNTSKTANRYSLEIAENSGKKGNAILETIVRGLEQSEKIQEFKKKFYNKKGIVIPELSMAALIRPLELIMEDNLLYPTHYRDIVYDQRTILDRPIKDRKKLQQPLITYPDDEEEEEEEMVENPFDALERMLDEEELIGDDLIQNDDMFSENNIADPSVLPILPLPEILIDIYNQPNQTEASLNKSFRDYCTILDKLKPKERKHEIPIFCNMSVNELSGLLDEEMPSFSDYSDDATPTNLINDNFMVTQTTPIPFRIKKTLLDDPIPVELERVSPLKTVCKKTLRIPRKNPIHTNTDLLHNDDIDYFVENQNRPNYYGTTLLTDLPSFIDVFVGENEDPYVYKRVADIQSEQTPQKSDGRQRDFIWFGDQQPPISEDEEPNALENVEQVHELSVKQPLTPSSPVQEIPVSWEIIAARLIHEKEKKLIAQGLLPDPRLIFKRGASKPRLLNKKKVMSKAKTPKQKKEESVEDLETNDYTTQSNKKPATKSKGPKDELLEKKLAELEQKEKIRKINQVIESAEHNFATLHYQRELAKHKPTTRNFRKSGPPTPEIPQLRLPPREGIHENLNEIDWEIVAARKVKNLQKKLIESGQLSDNNKPVTKTPARKLKTLKKLAVLKKSTKPGVENTTVQKKEESVEDLETNVYTTQSNKKPATKSKGPKDELLEKKLAELEQKEKIRKINQVIESAEHNFATLHYQRELAKHKPTTRNFRKSGPPTPEIPQLRLPPREGIHENLNEIDWEIVAARKVKNLQKKLIESGQLSDNNKPVTKTPARKLKTLKKLAVLKKSTKPGVENTTVQKKEESVEDLETNDYTTQSNKKPATKSKGPKDELLEKKLAELEQKEKIRKINQVIESAEQNFATLHYQRELAKHKPTTRNFRKSGPPTPEIPQLRLPPREGIHENLNEIDWEIVAARKVKNLQKKLIESGQLSDNNKPVTKTPARKLKTLKTPAVLKKSTKPVVENATVPLTKEERERLIAELVEAADINFANKIYQYKLSKEGPTRPTKPSRPTPPWKKNRQ